MITQTKIEYNQKENYLSEHKETMFSIVQAAFPDVDQERFDGVMRKHEQKIENAFRNGINIGGVIKYIVHPFDIAKQNGYYYFAVKEGKKTMLYSISEAI